MVLIVLGVGDPFFRDFGTYGRGKPGQIVWFSDRKFVRLAFSEQEGRSEPRALLGSVQRSVPISCMCLLVVYVFS